MTLLNLRNSIRYQAKLSSTDLADSDLNTIINRNYQKVVNQIMAFNETYFEISALASLVNAQAYYTFSIAGDFPFPTNVLKITRVEASYDGTNWYVANKMDKNERGETLNQDSIIKGAFSKTKPYYYTKDKTLFFLPTPTKAVANGAKMWAIVEQADLSADGDIPNLPPNYHYLIEKASLADIGVRLGDFALKDRMEQDYNIGSEKMRRELSPRDISGGDVLKAAYINYE